MSTEIEGEISGGGLSISLTPDAPPNRPTRRYRPQLIGFMKSLMLLKQIRDGMQLVKSDVIRAAKAEGFND